MFVDLYMENELSKIFHFNNFINLIERNTIIKINVHLSF